MSLPVLPTLIAAKIFAPTPRPDLLPRPRLTNRIGEGIAAGVKVVVMAAPPGFGKSTSSLEVAAAVRAGEDMWRVCVWSILRADEEKFEKSD